MTAIFGMAIPERPRAAQGRGAKQGGSYQRLLASHARTRWGTGPPSNDPLYARIIWFHSGLVAGDLDNIAKPILDSLCGIVFVDDKQIQQLQLRRVRLDSPSFILDRGADEPAEVRTLEALIGTNTNVLYIEVGLMEDDTIYFGQGR